MIRRPTIHSLEMRQSRYTKNANNRQRAFRLQQQSEGRDNLEEKEPCTITMREPPHVELG